MENDLIENGTNIVDVEINGEKFSVSEDELPRIISSQIDSISKLEKEVENSEASAKKAMELADSMAHYQEKGKGIFKHKSGDTKEIIEDSQNAIIEIAKSQQVSVRALQKSFEFQKKLAETSKYLFGLGCANITANRISVKTIEAKMNGATQEEISELAKEEMKNVVRQLKAQEDILQKQKELKEKVHKNTSRLDEKDIIDAEQTQRLEELGALLSNKDLIDQKQEESIKILFDYTKQKDELDKKQSAQIEKLLSASKIIPIVSLIISAVAIVISVIGICMK